MNREDDEKLWDLLSQASTPAAATPFFTRNVLRAIRENSSRTSGFAVGWYRRILFPAAIGFAALVLTFAGLRFIPRSHPETSTNQNAVLVADDDNQDDDLNLLAGNDDDSDDSQLL